MFTYSHANTTLSQSECAYYLSYFIIKYKEVVFPLILIPFAVPNITEIGIPN